MPRFITVNGKTYAVRGSWTLAELREQYRSFYVRYATTDLTFERWLVARGKVYFHIPKKRKES